MSDQPHSEPLRALDYYDETRFSAFLALRRLVLLGGAVVAALSTLNCCFEILRYLPQLLSALTVRLATMSGFYAFVMVWRILVGIGVTAGCLIAISHSKAALLTIIGEWILLFLSGISIFFRILMLVPSIFSSSPRGYFVSYIIPSIIGFLSTSVVPLLVIAVLMRKNMRLPEGGSN